MRMMAAAQVGYQQFTQKQTLLKAGFPQTNTRPATAIREDIRPRNRRPGERNSLVFHFCFDDPRVIAVPGWPAP